MGIDFSIGDLSDPNRYQENLVIDGYERSELLSFVRSILNIRLAEYKLARIVKMV